MKTQSLFLGWQLPLDRKDPVSEKEAHRSFTRAPDPKALSYDGEQHLITVAPTGSGKGAGVIIPNLLQYTGPVIVIDPKGENYLVTAGYRRKALKQDVFLLDPFHTLQDEIPNEHRRELSSLNPLDVLWNPALAVDLSRKMFLLEPDAQMLADQLNENDSELAPVWDRAAKSLLAGMIAMIANHPQREKRNLWILSQLLSHTEIDTTLGHLSRTAFYPWGNEPLLEGFNEAIRHVAILSWRTWNEGGDKMTDDEVLVRIGIRKKETLSEIEATWLSLFEARSQCFTPFVRREIGGYLSVKAADTRAGVIFTARSYLHFLFPGLEESLSATSDNLAQRAISGSGFSIYIVVPPEKLRSHAALIRLWISALITIMQKRKRLPKQRTLFLLDECAQLGTLSSLRQVVTLLRGKGVQAWMFFQDLGQLKLLYERDWPTLIDNCGIVQAFGIPRGRSARDIADVLGVEPETIRYMDDDEQIISRVRGFPTKAKLASYYKDDFFTGRYDSNPIYL